MSILKITDLNKKFRNRTILNELSLSVPNHSVFGFVGQNGAGKTTTIKIILGLLKADSGCITVCGEKVTYGETKTNKYIGYLSDVPAFYNYMKPLEYLKLCGEVTGIRKSLIRGKSQELLSLVDLKNENKKIGSFSRGIKQRLGIAQALLNEPKLLICDEPTSALDPIGRKEILDILLSIKGKSTVVFSTHILSDVEKICDQVALLNKGKIALSGSLAKIKETHRHNGYLIEFATVEKATEFANNRELIEQKIIVSGNNNSLNLVVSDRDSGGHFLLDLLSKKQLIPLKFEVIEPTLESLFTEVIK